MNKDLRTTVERKPAEKPHPAKVEETRVDLGALAPEGLPKDVTPEEIAALAAAAAQVQTKIEESRHAESAPATAQAEHHAQPMEPAKLAEEVPQEAAPLPVATFAEQKSEEKIEAKSEKIEEKSEPQSAEHPHKRSRACGAVRRTAQGSGQRCGSQHRRRDRCAGWPGTRLSHHRPEQLPATDRGRRARPTGLRMSRSTMAMAAGAASGGATSRWTAVSVALAPEEAAISLEQEMQKALCRFRRG